MIVAKRILGVFLIFFGLFMLGYFITDSAKESIRIIGKGVVFSVAIGVFIFLILWCFDSEKKKMNKFNSTIKQKVGECMDCQDGQQKPIIAGRCQFHYKLFREEERRKKSKERMIGEVDKVVGGKSELVLWFEDKMKNSKRVCENCGASLKHYNDVDWHGSQHHLLEKSLFPSIKTHPFNHGVLGKWCCHSQWHTSWANASKMPFFKVAKERFKLFEHDISPSEFKKIPLIFLMDI